MLKPLTLLFLLLTLTFINCHQSNDMAKFISEEIKQFHIDDEFPLERNIKQESCVPLITPIQYCDGLIPNNISYITSKSLNTIESKLISSIDNFITKMEVNYGSITENCRSSAINLYCSMSFKRCVHDRSHGYVELYKPCQYLCENLYFNCIPDRKVAIASSRNDCGDENYPKSSYSIQPTCTDVYFDRDLSSFYIMSFTLLGIGVMSSFICGGSFLICICCAKSIKPSNSTTGDAYQEQQSDMTSNNRQSINSGFRFSVDEGKPIFNVSNNVSNSGVVGVSNSVNGEIVQSVATNTGATSGGNSAFIGGGDLDGDMTVVNIGNAD